MIGHIKISRKILNWEWYNDPKMVHLFLHLLLKANWADGNWQGKKIKRGQYMTSVGKLSGNTGLSVAQIRACLSKMQSTNEITIYTTNKNSLITICNYDSYQTEIKSNNKQNDKQESNQSDSNSYQQDSNNIRRKEEKKIIIEFNTRPNASDFNGLPETKIHAAIEIVWFTQRTKITEEDVSRMWEVFKKQNLNGTDYYANEGKVYTHFIHWIKKQEFKNEAKIEKSKKSGQSSSFDAGKQTVYDMP